MAHIRVAGAGGLGMVAISIVIAIFLPRIRLMMALGFLLGCAMAAVFVAVRRRHDKSPAGTGPGAHALFPIDVARRAVKRDVPGEPSGDARSLADVPGVGASVTAPAI
ncbi:MAG TPA: hypothetical protein VFZ73_20180 [Gemmatimonadaceae bacterium]